MDDGDKQIKIIKRQNKKIGVLQRYIAYVSDVLSSIWIRRAIQVNDGNNWFILGCRYNFLFYFRLFLVVIYFFYETVK